MCERTYEVTLVTGCWSGFLAEYLVAILRPSRGPYPGTSATSLPVLCAFAMGSLKGFRVTPPGEPPGRCLDLGEFPSGTCIGHERMGSNSWVTMEH